MNYLYGLEIVSIQSYIFSTNKLREIIGASEVIESLAQEGVIEAILGEAQFKQTNLLLNAAGRITYLCADKSEAQKLLLGMEKKIQDTAPGLEFSQAVIADVEEEQLKTKQRELFYQLAGNRNVNLASAVLSDMIVGKGRRSGRKATATTIKNGNENEVVDVATYLKANKGSDIINKPEQSLLLNKLAIKKKAVFPKELADIGEHTEHNWIAVIHADGNRIGQVMQNIDQSKSTVKRYSQYLKRVTTLAISKAIEEVYFKDAEADSTVEIKPPIRPLIIGGDDISVICDAASSLKFVNCYLRHFESEAKGQLQEFRVEDMQLTACAGIAYTKAKFPFHYAHNLAVELCDQAKRKLNPNNTGQQLSGFCFHKVRDTIFDDYEDIIRRELSVSKIINRNGEEHVETIYLSSGPYTIANDQNAHSKVEDLKINLGLIGHRAFPLGPIREWLSALFEDTSRAQRLWENIWQRHGNLLNQIQPEIKNNPYLLSDLLTLESVGIKYI